jgi:hypothetical protein
VALDLRGHLTWSHPRRGEPVCIGVPLPVGAATSASDLRIETTEGLSIPLQARVLERWTDGSIRWILLDFQADANSDGGSTYFLCRGSGAAEPANASDALQLVATERSIEVRSAIATFSFETGGAFPFTRVTASERQPIDCEQSGLRVDHDGGGENFRIGSVRVLDVGPLRAAVQIDAINRAQPSSPLRVSARVDLFAGSTTARIAITLTNRRRASHPGGVWVLGDEGSINITSAILRLHLNSAIQSLRFAAESGVPQVHGERPWEIHQESSGGENWRSPVHRNRMSQVALRFRGYRLRQGSREQTGLRATPIVTVESSGFPLTVTMPQFWQAFPRSIGVTDSTIELGLFPRDAADSYELQGGEQKTFIVHVAFDRDPVSDVPLAWCHDPQLRYPSPEWCSRSQAIPGLIPAAEDMHTGYLNLVAAAIDPRGGFGGKREHADEFGWRHFGDLPADHESAFQPDGQWLVSHYNNQYDAIACFAVHFFRTADPRWWVLMMDLADHVRDVDIYHTNEDKAAYNGGLFWHTLHYLDAGTSNHRTYPQGSGGGGPAAEHNYNVGLMLHYFMTGDPRSRDAAIGLGQWVVDMDDGSKTVFSPLARGATGLASGGASRGYHGPGRGPANSILACLAAHRLSGDDAFARKADELIRRSIHPRDDVAGRNLLDVERRWSYTIFLQVLGQYLEHKGERGERDEMYEYARASLLHYARWMAANERPYLDHPELLEFPNETWAAQDMRKTDVFLWAARHSNDGERMLFFERARGFFNYSVETLLATPKHQLTRPMILALANGFRYGWFQRHHAQLPVAPPSIVSDWGPPVAFVPQKARALERAKWIGAAGVASVIAIVTAFLMNR